MKKFGFYCFDNAGGDVMKVLAETAQAMGHEVVLLPKQESAQDRASEMFDCDLVVTGLSSFRTEEELDLVKTLPTSVPWLVFEDVPGACLRPKAKELVKRARLVILAHLSGAQAAKDFWHDETIYIAPPPQWRLEYQAIKDAQAKNTRAEMCKIIGNGSLIPVHDADVLIGAGGGKDSTENNRVLRLLVEAVQGMHKAVICFSEHPAEKPKPKEGESESGFKKKLEAYQSFMDERAEILYGVWAVSPRSFKGAQVAGSVNVMLFFGGTNIQIASAFARIPNISLDDAGFRARMVAQSGQEKWFVNELGGAYVVNSAAELRPAIIKLTDQSITRSHLRELQETSFPVPPDFDDPTLEHTEHKIIRFLEQLQ